LSEYRYVGALAATADQLDQASVTVCKNAECVSGALKPAPASPGVGAGTWLVANQIRVILWTQATGHQLELDYFFTDGSVQRDGDQYSITVSDRNGAQVATTHETVRYVTSPPPGGPDCGPPCTSTMPIS
jgi:hypothetical protein